MNDLTRAGGAATIDRSKQSLNGDWWRVTILGVLCLLMMAPLFLALLISLKDLPQFTRNAFGLTFPLHWDNYVLAWSQVQVYILNSITASGLTVIAVLLVASLSAYAFAILRFPGREILFYVVLALIMIPSALTLVPLFVLVKDLGLLNTIWALVLPWTAGSQIIGIFILRAFFESLPQEIFDASRIDGASEWQNYFHVALPMCKSMLGVVAILNILGTWNDLIWPILTVNNGHLLTLTPGLLNFQTVYYTNYGQMMAGLMIGSIPLIVLFLFTSGWFVEGLTSGALKV